MGVSIESIIPSILSNHPQRRIILEGRPGGRNLFSCHDCLIRSNINTLLRLIILESMNEERTVCILLFMQMRELNTITNIAKSIKLKNKRKMMDSDIEERIILFVLTGGS